MDQEKLRLAIERAAMTALALERAAMTAREALNKAALEYVDAMRKISGIKLDPYPPEEREKAGSREPRIHWDGLP